MMSYPYSIFSKQEKYRVNIETHIWNFENKIQIRDRYFNGQSTYIFCNVCKISAIIIPKTYKLILRYQDAKLTCNQIIMKGILT